MVGYITHAAMPALVALCTSGLTFSACTVYTLARDLLAGVLPVLVILSQICERFKSAGEGLNVVRMHVVEVRILDLFQCCLKLGVSLSSCSQQFHSFHSFAKSVMDRCSLGLGLCLMHGSDVFGELYCEDRVL